MSASQATSRPTRSAPGRLLRLPVLRRAAALGGGHAPRGGSVSAHIMRHGTTPTGGSCRPPGAASSRTPAGLARRFSKVAPRYRRFPYPRPKVTAISAASTVWRPPSWRSACGWRTRYAAPIPRSCRRGPSRLGSRARPSHHGDRYPGWRRRSCHHGRARPRADRGPPRHRQTANIERQEDSP